LSSGRRAATRSYPGTLVDRWKKFSAVSGIELFLELLVLPYKPWSHRYYGWL
jgi:hypothetical protein